MKIYVVVREAEEAEDFQVVDVLQNRAFEVEADAKKWAKKLTRDFGGKFRVAPLDVEGGMLSSLINQLARTDNEFLKEIAACMGVSVRKLSRYLERA